MAIQNRTGTVWSDLCNLIFLLTKEETKLLELDSPIFDPLDELDSSMVNGLNDNSLHFYLRNKWITNSQLKELVLFRDFIDKIPNDKWSLDSFFTDSDWKLARGWAKKIANELNLTNSDWDSSGEQLLIV